ncbi:glyoxylate carboligase (tartronate-semialdehyde synthase) [Escherichia coli]|uniref:Glyoxylate carboligase (Tartronate-semialdehyde synthase) n=1 Tax=Escherichia coli TaxID=562 RepID=A0A377F9H7_ECOLX|nr:glyoxylate carboligase (tartronate-semialdehyde synthase) [Escherichia coli]
MAKMRAVDAAMYVLEKEGITTGLRCSGSCNQSVLLSDA